MIDWRKQPLGKVRDVDLAFELGVSHKVVWAARRRRGISRCTRPNRKVNCGLLAVVLAHLNLRPKGVRELHTEVLNDWGRISERQIFRALTVLCAEGRIVREGKKQAPPPHGGYRRAA